MTVRFGALSAVLVLAAGAMPSALASQTYTKLLTNGRGLALTQLSVREKSGTSWIVAPSYIQGREYRLTVRLTNFFPTTISVGNPFASCHVFYMVDVGFSVFLSGAVFTSASSNSSTVDHWQISGAHTIGVTDLRRLDNTKSRTYYVYFQWNGPNVPIPVLDHKVSLRGGEVCLLPNQSPFPLRASG